MQNQAQILEERIQALTNKNKKTKQKRRKESIK
jgi:hypothetical protein